jgi:hypothetical protein
MSDELYGEPALEAEHGYTSMPTAEPAAEETDPIYDFAKRRDEEAAKTETIERNYVTVGGEHAGEPRPDNETLDIERAAEDLTRIRNQEVADQQNQIDSAIAAEVDALRNPHAQQQQQDQPEPTIEPQPEIPADVPGVDPELARALQNPKVREPLEQLVAQAEQTRSAYAQAAYDAYSVAAVAALAAFPELQGLTGQQVPVALQMIQQKDPARFSEIRSQLDRVDSLHRTVQQAQAQQAQVNHARYEQWSAEQDKAFEDAVKDVPAATREAVEKNIIKVAQDVYGVSKDDLAAAWRSNPLLRSAPMQRMMFDAIQYNLIKSNAASAKVPPSVPPVQRPGVSSDQPDHNDYEIGKLARRFESSGDPRDGAALLAAKRAARAARG